MMTPLVLLQRWMGVGGSSMVVMGARHHGALVTIEMPYVAFRAQWLGYLSIYHIVGCSTSTNLMPISLLDWLKQWVYRWLATLVLTVSVWFWSLLVLAILRSRHHFVFVPPPWHVMIHRGRNYFVPPLLPMTTLSIRSSKYTCWNNRLGLVHSPWLFFVRMLLKLSPTALAWLTQAVREVGFTTRWGHSAREDMALRDSPLGKTLKVLRL